MAARAPATGRRLLTAHMVLLYAFLYAPILVLIVLSFNASGLPTAWGGFSFKWYASVIGNEAILDSVKTTLIIASAVTVLSTIIGTLLALGLERTVKSTLLDSLVFVPAVIPDIVLAVALLSFYSLVRLTLGLQSIILAHVVFDMVFVMAIVRTRLSHFDRSIEEAALDLGANRLATFFRVTLPMILPGVIAGGLVAFTLSVDEFIVAFFTAGPSTITFPIRIYSMIRFGVTPEINAIAAFVLLLGFTSILVALRLNRRAGERALRAQPRSGA